MKKIEIGYTVEKERWKDAAENLERLGRILAANFLRTNRDGRGKEDADDIMADITLARIALAYVAEFAVDKCRFVPVGEGKRREKAEQ